MKRKNFILLGVVCVFLVVGFLVYRFTTTGKLFSYGESDAYENLMSDLEELDKIEVYQLKKYEISNFEIFYKELVEKYLTDQIDYVDFENQLYEYYRTFPLLNDAPALQQRKVNSLMLYGELFADSYLQPRVFMILYRKAKDPTYQLTDQDRKLILLSGGVAEEDVEEYVEEVQSKLLTSDCNMIDTLENKGVRFTDTGIDISRFSMSMIEVAESHDPCLMESLVFVFGKEISYSAYYKESFTYGDYTILYKRLDDFREESGEKYPATGRTVIPKDEYGKLIFNRYIRIEKAFRSIHKVFSNNSTVKQSAKNSIKEFLAYIGVWNSTNKHLDEYLQQAHTSIMGAIEELEKLGIPRNNLDNFINLKGSENIIGEAKSIHEIRDQYSAIIGKINNSYFKNIDYYYEQCEKMIKSTAALVAILFLTRNIDGILPEAIQLTKAVRNILTLSALTDLVAIPVWQANIESWQKGNDWFENLSKYEEAGIFRFVRSAPWLAAIPLGTVAVSGAVGLAAGGAGYGIAAKTMSMSNYNEASKILTFLKDIDTLAIAKNVGVTTYFWSNIGVAIYFCASSGYSAVQGRQEFLKYYKQSYESEIQAEASVEPEEKERWLDQARQERTLAYQSLFDGVISAIFTADIGHNFVKTAKNVNKVSKQDLVLIKIENKEEKGENRLKTEEQPNNRFEELQGRNESNVIGKPEHTGFGESKRTKKIVCE